MLYCSSPSISAGSLRFNILILQSVLVWVPSAILCTLNNFWVAPKSFTNPDSIKGVAAWSYPSAYPPLLLEPVNICSGNPINSTFTWVFPVSVFDGEVSYSLK